MNRQVNLDMATQPKILLLDDDQEFLDLYKEMFSQHLPSMPEVRVATSAARAFSMLEAEPYNLLSVDLNLPKMDGLQVISIARRKFPQVRMVVLTGIRDEQFRNRAYALGVDQFWVKPESDEEIGLLMEAFESLLTQDAEGGFRGVQSKSLMDIIQLECLSQSSSTLRITNGRQEGRIWIQNGELVDAELGDMTSEDAFSRMLGWRTGTFEILPPDPERKRTIFTSYQGLLLNSVQAMDEQESFYKLTQVSAEKDNAEPVSRNATLLAELAQMPGVEFILTQEHGQERTHDYFGLDNPEPLAKWSRDTWSTLQSMGDTLQVGQLQEVVGIGHHKKVALLFTEQTNLTVGMTASLSQENTRDILKSILTKWAS